MSNKINIWSDAPEGTEFIVEFDDGEIHYYKTIGVALCVVLQHQGHLLGLTGSYQTLQI